jgi:DNA ligase-1
MAKLHTLFSRASTGALREWTIEYNDTAYRTHSGQVGGKITTSKWYDVKATNVGRANERSVSQQAEFEAQAKWQKKLDAGYTADAKAVDTSVKFISPTLAKKWEDRKDKIEYPVFSQPKLDGMRAVITKDGAKSRNGKPWVTIPHILASLEEVFRDFPDLVLDGELYNHEYKEDFNKICSLAKKTKPTVEDLEESAEKLEFHWYDIADPADPNKKFAQRTKDIASIYRMWGLESSAIRMVETNIHSCEASVDSAYKDYVDRGYEGQMIRENIPYEFKRSSGLLKRKDFQDDEYIILAIAEGKGNKSGMAGYAILQTEDGRTFNSNIKGTHDFLKDLLENADTYIGSYGTCTFFSLTPDGIPRFPYLTRLRDGKSVD